MSPTPPGTIARHLAPSPPDDRTFRRRRLASLAAVLTLVLAVGSLVDGGSDDVVDVTTDVAAGDEVVRAAALDGPTGVRELLSETTTTLVEASGATTTTEAPTTTTTVATTEPTAEDESEPESTTTTAAPLARALTTGADDESEAPTTTAAPRPAPATTVAPTTTTTTTAPPEATTSSEDYAYDDPRSTHVWYDLAQCESGGDWSINTGNGYYGGLQFSLGTWESVGGSGYPHEHPASTQIEFGRELQARQGWEAWPHCSEELGLR
ncbi:MAG: transglycosylase family protein [Acidimicrobiia bacterium]